MRLLPRSASSGSWTWPGACSRWTRCIFKKTVETVTSCGGYLLCQLKANQPRLHEAMREHAQQRPPADCARSCEIGQRNRIEQREVRVWALPAGSGVQPWHDHFLSLIEVRRSTEVFDTAKGRFIARAQAPAYYLT